MSASSKIAIDIVTAFKGKQSVDQATKSFDLLGKSVNHLGAKLATVFSVSAITAFGTASANAFLKTDAAMKQLDQTLYNVGQGFAALSAENMIKSLSLASGVAEDKLIPAYSALVRGTKNAAKAQELLQLSLDISAGTGRDLETVATSLTKAYGGNVTALGRLGTGLTKAQLTSGNFLDIQKQLTQLFKGDAQTAADTYAGKLNRLKEGFKQFEEGVGKGIVTGFDALAGQGGNLDTAINKMVMFGQVTGVWISSIISHLDDLGRAINKVFPALGWIMSHTIDGWSKILGVQDAQVAIIRQSQKDAYEQAKLYEKQQKAQADLNKQLATQQAKADAAAKKAAQDKLALDKASALLKKQQSIFDNQQAEIYAALQNDRLDANDKLRLQMLQTEDQLAAAIQDQNIPLVQQLTEKLQQQTDQFAVMQHIDPYTALAIGVDAATAKILAAYQAQLLLNAAIAAMPSPASFGSGINPNYSNPLALTDLTPLTQSTVINAVISPELFAGIQLNATVALDSQVIQQSLVNNSASGTPVTYSRSNSARVGDW